MKIPICKYSLGVPLFFFVLLFWGPAWGSQGLVLERIKHATTPYDNQQIESVFPITQKRVLAKVETELVGLSDACQQEAIGALSADTDGAQEKRDEA